MTSLEDMNLSSSKQKLYENYIEAKKEPSFVKLINRLHLKDEEAMKITSKLQDTLQELHHCEGCQGLQECKNSYQGHVLFPENKEEKIYFSYAPCKYQKAFLKMKKEKENLSNVNANARIRDIDGTSDKKRMPAIKWILKFLEDYDYSKDMKGLYLSGSFGSGKTFLISALFHELEITNHVSTLIVYFPEALRTLKDDWEEYESKMQKYQTVDLLLLDDIGAEKVTEWGRDEVLGTILQYRMDHHLPTFFTSNMNLKELESHLATIGRNVDMVKSRRIIERIKQTSETLELTSENRRK